VVLTAASTAETTVAAGTDSAAPAAIAINKQAIDKQAVGNRAFFTAGIIVFLPVQLAKEKR
jgi:hypothetical protein